MKPYPKEFINYIRQQVKAGVPKYKVARELGISDTTVYVHTIDLPSRSQLRELSQETIAKVREEILKGKSKSRSGLIFSWQKLLFHPPSKIVKNR